MKRSTSNRRGLPASAGVSIHADKRFLRPDVRPVRRRRLRALVRPLGRIVLPAGLILLVGAWIVRMVIAAPVFAVNHLVVHGNSRLSSAQIEALLNGIRGQSILLVNFDRFTTQLKASPWIADATLSRVLPATVDVKVSERTPVAIARRADHLLLVDRDGNVIDEFGPAYHDVDLPIVDGLFERDVVTADAARAQVAAAFLEALQRDADIRTHVSQIDVSNAHDVVVLLDDEPVALHLGDEQFVERIRTYLVMAPTLRDQLADIDYVDLRFGGRVYARSRNQSTVAAIPKKRMS